MLQPGAAYRRLAAHPPSGRWLLFRRPLLVAFVLGCTVSLLTARGLSLGLVASGAVTWSFVPLLEMGALAVVWSFGNRRLSLPRAVDAGFTGHAAWSLWLLLFGAWWSRFPLPIASEAAVWFWLTSAAAVLAWSAWVDYCFHRSVLDSSPAQSLRNLVVQRGLCWIPGIILFGYGSLWSDLVELWR